MTPPGTCIACGEQQVLALTGLLFSVSRIVRLMGEVSNYLDLYQHVGVAAEHMESLKVSLKKMYPHCIWNMQYVCL